MNAVAICGYMIRSASLFPAHYRVFTYGIRGIHRSQTYHQSMRRSTTRCFPIYGRRRSYGTATPHPEGLLDQASAVFAPNGRCVHRQDSTSPTERKQLLDAYEAYVAHANGLRDGARASTHAKQLMALFDEGWSFVEGVKTGDTYYTVAVESPAGGRSPLRLPPREQAALLLASQGRCDGEVAHILNVSLGTASKYIKDARRKLPVKDGFELVQKLGHPRIMHMGKRKTHQLAIIENSSASDTYLPPAGLTTKEVPIYRAVIAGHARRKIADETRLSLQQVNRLISSIFRKVQVGSRTELLFKHLMSQDPPPDSR